MKIIQKAKNRSKYRLLLGNFYYGLRRKMFWIKNNSSFAKKHQDEKLEFTCFSHKTILLRKLKDVDMYLQHNKITNLKIASKKIDKITIYPNETFSYWKLIGNPTKRKGYVDGMILQNGNFKAGTGGGLCQLSNILFWVAVHSPLTITERHRHGYDVFPDSNRTQPFGSGATCFYPHGDLMIKNETDDIYQFLVYLDDEFLHCELRTSAKPEYKYEIVEKSHNMQRQYWGGFTRHNELYKQKFNLKNELISEDFLLENSAIMMYAPFLESQSYE